MSAEPEPILQPPDIALHPPRPGPGRPGLLRMMGPGLITGASDDDPSGIATYSQAGAQLGYGLAWTLLFSWPLMCAIQEISARIGRVTGRGLAGNMLHHYPGWMVGSILAALVVANVINLGADLGAMGAALQLVAGGPLLPYVIGFGVLSIVLETFVHYARYVSVLKWLAFSLLSYVAVALVVHVPWGLVLHRLVVPHATLDGASLTVIVAVLGTTISPYLFFWQAEEEVEEIGQRPGAVPLLQGPDTAAAEFRRIRTDTWIGMGVSNLVALSIMVTTAATLHAHGITDIQTSSQAALALRPIAGRFAFTLFALGIIGTGLLAVPVLAGSTAYALGESLGWVVGLEYRPARARAFYGALAASIGLGCTMSLVHVDPVKALFWSAVVNGVAAVPVMALTMRLACRPSIMGRFVLPPALRAVGWIATAVMAAAALGMFATL